MQPAVVSRILGVAHEEEEEQIKRIRKISAITLLKNFERGAQTILVLAKDFVDISNEIKEYLGAQVLVTRRQSNMVTIETTKANHIFCLTSDPDHWGLKGVRAQVLIVEGKRAEAKEEFLNEVVWPMMGVMFDPQVSARLSQACGEQLHKYARKAEVIFSDD